jgi:hypothetical protein
VIWTLLEICACQEWKKKVRLGPLLEQYDWEKMNPKDRWEQEQIKDMQQFSVLK